MTSAPIDRRPRRTALIVGAGVSGLAAGIALRRSRWDVTVLERADGLRPIGAGLSIWPNGVVALRALGVGSIADSTDVPRSDGAIRDAAGAPLARFDPVAIERRFGAPLVGVHRADLHEALLDALGESPRTGAEVVAVGPGSAALAGGERLRADLIVGADGIRSTVRERLIGPEQPTDSGIVAWRGVTGFEREIPAGEWWGEGCVAGLLPLSGGRIYWYVAYRGAEGEAAELRRRAAEFGEPVGAVIAATDPGAVLSHRLFDRPVARDWSRGPVTLVGDAAHPMLPFLGQGACAALEDGVALGTALAGDVAVEAGLRAYGNARRTRAAKLVRGSRSAARVALLTSATGRAIRNWAVTHTPEPIRMRQLERIVG